VRSANCIYRPVMGCAFNTKLFLEVAILYGHMTVQ
jgi:hypothetical protein